MFASLSDRLTSTFKNLRSKGRLSEADIDATIREIRRALLDADVAVSVVRDFTGAVRERALSAEVSGALNPAQQVVKIVHDELVTVLGGTARPLQRAKTGPTVIMLAGLQGAGKTTLAGKLAVHLREQGHTPMLIAADLQRPNAVQQLKIVGERAGVPVYAPHPGNQGEGLRLGCRLVTRWQLPVLGTRPQKRVSMTRSLSTRLVVLVLMRSSWSRPLIFVTQSHRTKFFLSSMR